MFDLIKMFLGRSHCKGCKYRRFWGLFCGNKSPKPKFYEREAWNKYGCWDYVEDLRAMRTKKAR